MWLLRVWAAAAAWCARTGPGVASSLYPLACAQVWHLRRGNIIRQAEGPRPRTLPGPEAWYWLERWCAREKVDLSTWDIYSRVSCPIPPPPPHSIV